jgi:hypothetical protein
MPKADMNKTIGEQAGGKSREAMDETPGWNKPTLTLNAFLMIQLSWSGSRLLGGFRYDMSGHGSVKTAGQFGLKINNHAL